MDITFDRVTQAARLRLAALTPEVAGYVVLLVARALDRPERVSLGQVSVDEFGQIHVQGGQPVPEREAEAALRGMLGTLLALSPSQPPAIAAVAERATGLGLRCFDAELMSALIPINPAAAGRALARLYREIQRALADGVELGGSVDLGGNAQRGGSAAPGAGAVRGSAGFGGETAALAGAASRGSAAPGVTGAPGASATFAGRVELARAALGGAPPSSVATRAAVVEQAAPPATDEPSAPSAGETAHRARLRQVVAEPALDLDIDVDFDLAPDQRSSAVAAVSHSEVGAALDASLPAQSHAEEAARYRESELERKATADLGEGRGGEPDDIASRVDLTPGGVILPQVQVTVMAEPTSAASFAQGAMPPAAEPILAQEELTTSMAAPAFVQEELTPSMAAPSFAQEELTGPAEPFLPVASFARVALAGPRPAAHVQVGSHEPSTRHALPEQESSPQESIETERAAAPSPALEPESRAQPRVAIPPTEISDPLLEAEPSHGVELPTAQDLEPLDARVDPAPESTAAPSRAGAPAWDESMPTEPRTEGAPLEIRATGESPEAWLELDSAAPATKELRDHRSTVGQLVRDFLLHTRSEEAMTLALRRAVGIGRRATRLVDEAVPPTSAAASPR
jgi:hypothetical protein